MFLPDNYEAPKSQGNYLKLQDGDNKIRILSKPIIGWEDWDDRTPIRYRHDQKPQASKDAKRPIKHFWAMVVWSYDNERIMIWHVTQASILREINQLVQDPDWGSPFGYDIKVNRSGQEMRTKYSVKPLPHKPISNAMIEAFQAKPCWLEALFEGQDPFAEWPQKTGLGADEPKAKDGNISQAQYQELLDLIFDDKEYLAKLEANVKKHFNCELKLLPASKYDAILKSVKIHAKERAEKEAESLPF